MLAVPIEILISNIKNLIHYNYANISICISQMKIIFHLSLKQWTL
jgi:hypothetical protein